ncbi:putative polyketide synthase (OzmK) [Streptomyces bingchenggensis BCW-1]|uniref:Putative polyketide synthase (OzmK) n=1 Tax=Streptomyces bingchenggensis (strain BCW-1) TaxID=749414 RepID=D7C9Q6_STRBB|nr:beta-ketoacyl synthase N-terminal-like domain-containing protein [Streptomyces bingchenggensis]ADI12768.1 putative polyketide synthase (OzmK) [Streptomyces bingchenggensis BCW-1]
MSPHVKQTLSELAARVLDASPERVAEASFQELGLGLVAAVELTEEVNARFGTALPTSAVTEAGDLGRLAERVEATLARQAAPPEAVAVIGMHCRTAGAADPEELWEVISEGRDCTGPVADPVALSLFREHFPDAAVPSYGAMAEAECFDPAFFRISPREAAAMDAAQRVLLESCYHALEDAAQDASALRGRAVATVVGSTGLAPQSEYSAHALMGSDTSIMAARLAYHLDLAGPALTVDTACSSSLVAVDIARRLLLSGEAELALAAGVYVVNHPGTFVTMEALGTVSPRRTCRPFDAEADGMLVGDGVGVLVLKRLSDAVRDNDRILGVIRGSATNQDGRTSGITSPSSTAQSALLREVYRRSGVDMGRLRYVEAHGTGTSLGDPIEVHGLTEAFEEFTERKQFCAIGSVKANIGHTMGAAGVLGAIKVLLCLRYGKLPPAANFRDENKHVDFADSPVYVNREPADWAPDGTGPRLAGVSSFGYSGTNAHVIIEEYPAAERRAPAPPRRQLVPLSAKTDSQLRRKAGALAARLRDEKQGEEKPGDAALRDVAYTLQVGREAFPERLAVSADSMSELIERLEAFAGGADAARGAHRGRAPEDRTGGQAPTAAGRDVDELAAAWATGAAVDWPRLHTGGAPRRIQLPGHPFEREVFRHVWADGAPAETPGHDTAPPRPAAGAVPSVLVELDAAAEEHLRADPSAADIEAALRNDVMVRELAKVCREMLFASLRRMEVFQAPGERHGAPALIRRLGVVDEHTSLFRALLGILTDDGLLRAEGEELVTTDRVADPALVRWEPDRLEALKREVTGHYPEMEGYFRLLTSCLEEFPAILTGRRKAHEVLFPDGSFDAVEAVYHSDQDTNALVAQLVAAYARARLARDPGAEVSVLEIGAGTGGTTAKVLPALDGLQDRLRYAYTDISRSFTLYGRNRYAKDHPFLSFQQLDIESPPAEQGFEAGAYDVVLACNVLHATRRIDDSLAHARQLLRPGGVLILLETTRVQEFFTLTFGLMAGWWAFQDHERRLPGSPLLSVALWRQALEQGGFRAVRSLSLAPVREDQAYQAVVLAENEGALTDTTAALPPLPAQTPVAAAPVTVPAEPPVAAEPVPVPDHVPVAEAAEAAEAAAGSLQAMVVDAWREVLGVASARPEDDFQELGGDSILATQVISRLKSGFPIELDLGELFQARTLADMVAMLEAELVERIEELPEDTVATLLA